MVIFHCYVSSPEGISHLWLCYVSVDITSIYLHQFYLHISHIYHQWLCSMLCLSPHVTHMGFISPINGDLQDPKMEVLYHIRPYFVVIFTYIGLKHRPKIYGRYLHFRILKISHWTNMGLHWYPNNFADEPPTFFRWLVKPSSLKRPRIRWTPVFAQWDLARQGPGDPELKRRYRQESNNNTDAS